MIVREKPEWGELATFKPNKKLPVYRWFYYKEGYARDLVFEVIRKFGLNSGQTVLDPFCGVGTTLLACREKGLESVGFDVNPPAVFASTVKTRDYDVRALKNAADDVLARRFESPDLGNLSPLAKRAFNRHTLDDVLFFRNSIMQMDDRTSRDFLMLALINVSMKCSYAWKDGAVIKIRRHPVPPLRKLLKRQIGYMIRDIARLRLSGADADVRFGDARKMNLPDSTADAVITSPPYLNKIEYSKVYSLENELFFSGLGLAPVRSHIGIRPEDTRKEEDRLSDVIDTSDLNEQSLAYFNDMHDTIKEMHRVTKDGGMSAVVVGNGCFPNGVVDSDMILSRIAEHAGFEAQEVLVLSKRWCTRNRVEKVGQTRESLLVWKK